MASLPSFGGFWFFIFLQWLLYTDIVISNMYVHFHHHFYIAQILFNVGFFVTCMLPLPYSPNCSVFFILWFFVRLLWHYLQSNFHLWSLQGLSHCANGKQFGILRQAVNLLAQTKESGRRNPNNPHIKVMLQFYWKHPSRNKIEIWSHK